MYTYNLFRNIYIRANPCIHTYTQTCKHIYILTYQVLAAGQYTDVTAMWCAVTRDMNTATHCNSLQLTATHCNTLQHTAIHCNTLQHTT